MDTKATIRCSEGCRPDTDTPFVYPPIAVGWGLQDATAEPELGVLADATGEPVNRWADGTVGVPDLVLLKCREWPEWPDCVECGGDAENIA